MYFEELSIQEKVEFTVNDFKHRDALAVSGRKDADQYIKENYSKIRKGLRGEKKASIRGKGNSQ